MERRPPRQARTEEEHYNTRRLARPARGRRRRALNVALALVLFLVLVLAARAAHHNAHPASPLAARAAAHRQRRRTLLSAAAARGVAAAASGRAAPLRPAAAAPSPVVEEDDATTTDDAADSKRHNDGARSQQQVAAVADAAASSHSSSSSPAPAAHALPLAALLAPLKRAYAAAVARRETFAAIKKSVRTTVAEQEQEQQEQEEGESAAALPSSPSPPPPQPPLLSLRKKDLLASVAARVQQIKQTGDTLVLQRSLEQQLKRQWDEDNRRAAGGAAAVAGVAAAPAAPVAAPPAAADDHENHHHAPGERCSTPGPSGQRLALVLEQAELERDRQEQEDAEDARRRGPLWRLRAAAHAMRTGGKGALEAFLRRLEELDREQEAGGRRRGGSSSSLGSSRRRLAEDETTAETAESFPPTPTLRKTKRVRTRRDAAADAKESSPASATLAALPPGPPSDEEPSPPPQWPLADQEAEQQLSPPPAPPPAADFAPSWGSLSNPTFNTGPGAPANNNNGPSRDAPPDGTLPPAPVRVPLHVHVIVAGPNGPAPSGVSSLLFPPGMGSSSSATPVPRLPEDVPLSRVHAQVDALNAHFGRHDIRFALQLPIHIVTDPQWAAVRLGSPEEAQMKRELRRGGAESLNLYVLQPADGILGWSTFPFDYAANPTADGVVILHDTMPGGQAAPYNLGMTAVHETGHWMGLFHPWQGGCSGGAAGGDGVADTPPARRAAYGCPAQGSVDTCSSASSPDAITNAMGYVDDRCMTGGFTPGQAARMRVMWRAYRRTGAARVLERRALAGEPLEAMFGWWEEEQARAKGGEEEGEPRLVLESAPARPALPPPPPPPQGVRPAAASPKLYSPPAAAVAPLYRAGASLKGMSVSSGGRAGAAAVDASALFAPAASAAVAQAPSLLPTPPRGGAAAPSPYAAQLTQLLQQQQQQQQRGGGGDSAALAAAIFGGGGGGGSGSAPAHQGLAFSMDEPQGGDAASLFAPAQPLLPEMAMTMGAPRPAQKSALQLTREMPAMLASMYGRGY